MTQPKHIVFDLDGTLLHSAPDIHAAINFALANVGRPQMDLDTVISFIGNGVETLVTRSLDHTGEPEDDLHARTLAHFLRAYNADPFSRTKPYPGVVASLEQLKAKGLKLAICTNKPSETALEICAALDLTDFFDVISGATPDVPKKPDPTPLERVIECLDGQATNTVYVGDSAVDQATARNASVPFVLFSGGYLNTPLDHSIPLLTFGDWADDWYSSLG